MFTCQSNNTGTLNLDQKLCGTKVDKLFGTINAMLLCDQWLDTMRKIQLTVKIAPSRLSPIKKKVQYS